MNRWIRVNTGPTITHYEVQYGVSPVQNESSWASVDPAPTVTQTIIQNLDSNTAYDVRVRAVNDDGASPWSNSDTGSTSPAQLTVAFSATTYTMNEGHEAIITVTVAPTADRDVTVTVTLSGEGATPSGLDTGNTLTIAREMNSTSFTISADQDVDTEDGLVTLALTTDDDKVTLNPSTATVSINDDDNSLPTFNDLDPAERLVPENSDAGTPVGAAVSATDADQNDTLTYSIIDTSGKFRIDNSTGEIRVNIDNSLNYEEQNTYLTTVSVTDGKATVGLTVNILVSNVNEPPDAPSELSVSANEDNPTTAFDVSWTAPDTTGIPTITGYDMRYRTRGNNHWKDHDFDSEGSTTKTTITGLAPNTTHQVQVRARNDEGKGQWATVSATTATPEPTNTPPIITTISPLTIQENQTAVVTLEATDPEDDPITGWSVTGGADSALFTLTTGGELYFITPPNYENLKDDGRDNSYEVKVDSLVKSLCRSK